MKRIFILFLLFGLALNGMGQKVNISIINEETENPFEGVHFSYAGESGISDESGRISLDSDQKGRLLLSHISFGRQYFSESAVRKAMTSGRIVLSPRIEVLSPAIVLAKSNPQIANNLRVSETDKLSHDAAAFLKQVPLISSIQKGGNYGFDPVMRGFKYDQLNIVMGEGICATAACPNRMDPPASQIPMNMVEKVEILKGPYSLRYGTGFGGTINFQSQTAEYTQKNKTNGRLSAGYDGNGSIYRTEGKLGVSGSFYDVSLYGSYAEGTDYEDGSDSLVQADFNRLNLGTRMNFRINKSNSLTVDVANNSASDVDFPALNMDLRSDNTWLMSAAHKLSLDEGILQYVKTSISGSFVKHQMDNYDKVLVPRKVNAITDANTQNIGARSEGLFNFQSAKLYAGLDFKQQGADGERARSFLMGPMKGNTAYDNIWLNSKISETAVFGEYHHSFTQSRMVASMRLSYNQADAADAADNFQSANADLSSSHVNPSMSFGYEQDLPENMTLGLWLGRAQRSGSLTERYINYLPVGRDPYERVGNASLKPEVNNQIDLDFKWKPSSTFVSVNLFTSYLTDYISSEIRSDLSPLLATAPGVKQYINLETALLAGFEVSWSQQWLSHFYSNFSMAYTYGESLVDNTPLPEIAPLDYRFLVGANLFKGRLKPELSYRLVADQNRIAETFGETKTSGFNVLDLDINFNANDHFAFKVGMSNITDQTYYEHLSRSVAGGAGYRIYAPGRSVFARITYTM